MDQASQSLVHRNMLATPERLHKVLQPYLKDIVIAVEGIFTWYWIADFWAQQNLPFVLDHALYMRAIYGAKTKSDKIDSPKIAALLRGGMLPMAYVYPAKMRST